ncbi:MAG: hypothetical protein HKN42_07300, partial [Granulosicoccus sp.]|nr:hypothetical protein [Granulosicoccus sp.]
ASMALDALATDLHGLDESLAALDAAGQANVLDLLSDYERYDRLKSNPSAQGSNDRERTILSRRSKLGIRTIQPDVVPPAAAPDAGHGTARLSVLYHETENGPPIAELQLRPAYHDFRDPSAAFDDKAAIQLGLIGVARDLEDDRSFVRRFTLIRIESIEPRGEFFKPISWHTRLDWQRRTADARHEFTFNVGAGAAFQKEAGGPVAFIFGESDIVDAPAFDSRQQLRLGASAGAHWEPETGARTGIELNARRQIDGPYYELTGELWAGIALHEQLSLNLSGSVRKSRGIDTTLASSVELRFYF